MNRNQFFGDLLRRGLAAGALAAPLALGSTGVALASNGKDDDNRGRGRDRDDRRNAEALATRRAAIGTVKSIDTNARSFVLTTDQGDLTITTNNDTTYHAPGNRNAVFADIRVNTRVAVMGDRPNATTLLAKRVMLGKDSGRTTTTGTINEVAGDRTSFRLTPNGSSTAMTFRVTGDTVTTIRGTAAFAAGQTARVISVKDTNGADVALRIRIPAP